MDRDSFIKDVSRDMSKESHSSELSPGQKRRYEPAQGVRKHNERIHKESALMDKYGALPYSFSKPSKSKSNKLVTKVCANCGREVFVRANTVGIICGGCKEYSRVIDIDDIQAIKDNNIKQE